MAEVLLALAKENQVQIMFVPKVVEHVQVRSVSGGTSVEEKLDTLLAGTSLEYLKVSDTVFIIQAVKQKLLADNPPKNVETGNPEDTRIERIRVLGSHIIPSYLGQNINSRVYSQQLIHQTGVTSTGELFAHVPQIGEIFFNQERSSGGINDARGDIASVNLRGLGTGYTLSLVNGRRMALHPANQTENFVPVTTFNQNILPPSSISQLEVMLDGASALYGSEAVAGVVNYRLERFPQSQLATTLGSNNRGYNFRAVNLSHTLEFGQGGALGMGYWHYDKNGMSAINSANSASQDRRNFPGLSEQFSDDLQFDNRSVNTQWGNYFSHQLGQFHFQANNDGNCQFLLDENLCLADGAIPRKLRFDRAPFQTLSPDVVRDNVQLNIVHPVTSDSDLFSEFLYYRSSSERQREQAALLSSQRFWLSGDAYYNPLGEDIFIIRYRPVDVGPRTISTDNHQYRWVTGIKGAINDWDYETAVLLSKSYARDKVDNRIHLGNFYRALNSNDADTGYNLFTDKGNSDSVIDTFTESVSRVSRSALKSWDLKLSNSEFHSSNGVLVAVAGGLEWRIESYMDDRGPLLDGSVPFVDADGELISPSSVLGSSYTLDSEAKRRVWSAYLESIVNVRQRFNAQFAVRYENYTGFGAITKPRVSLAWQVLPEFTLRSSFSKGFKAPELAQIAEQGVARVNVIRDPLTDESYGIQDIRSGNPELQPELNDNISAGLIWEISTSMNVTLDVWKIQQQQLVGLLSSQTLLLDNALNIQAGIEDNRVERDELGFVTGIHSQYQNLNPREMQGADLQVQFKGVVNETKWEMTLNTAYLNKFEQQADPISLRVIEALGNQLPADVQIENVGSLLELNGRPKWRVNLHSSWQYQNWYWGFLGNYVSGFFEDSVNDGQGNLYRVNSHTSWNAFIGGEFEVNQRKLRLSLNIENLFDRQAPLADETFGYFSEIHNNRGRTLSAQINWLF